MHKKRDWKSIVGDWKESGLTQSEYCRKHGLSGSALSVNARKYKPTTFQMSNFIELAAPDHERIEIVVGDRIKVRLPLSTSCDRISELVSCLV